MTTNVKKNKNSAKYLLSKTKKLTKDHRLTLFTSVLFILTIISRLNELLNKNDYFGYEQGIDMLIAKKIVIDHIFPLIGYEVGGVGGFSKGPLWNYILAIPFLITNGDPFGERILMFILSTSMVILAFFLFKKIFSVGEAFTISTFLMLSPSLITHAGIVWPPLAMPILIIFYIYFLYLLLEGKKNSLLLIVGSIALMTHFEVATAGILLTQICAISIFLIIKQKLRTSTIILSILIFIFITSPVIIFDLLHKFTNTKGILNLLFHHHTKQNPNFIYTFSQRFETYIWNFRSTFTPNIYLSSVFFILLLIAFYFFEKDKKIAHSKRLLVAYLLLNPLASFLMLLFYPGDIFEWWLIYQTVFYCIGVGILIKYYIPKKHYRFITTSTLVLFISIFLLKEFTNSQKTIATIKETNIIKRQIPIDYIINSSKGRSFDIKIIAPRKNTQEYEYLIWHTIYTGKIKPVQNPAIHYIITEQDYNHPVKLTKSIMKNKTYSAKSFENGKYTVQKYLNNYE